MGFGLMGFCCDGMSPFTWSRLVGPEVFSHFFLFDEPANVFWPSQAYQEGRKRDSVSFVSVSCQMACRLLRRNL